jgi:hypothetical protein
MKSALKEETENQARKIQNEVSGYLSEQLTLLKEADISEELYCSTGIGRHIRHTRDFIERFIEGQVHGEISYTQRDRTSFNQVRIMKEKEYGYEKLENSLQAFSNLNIEEEFVLVNGEFGSFEASILSELDRIGAHTVHHFGTIRTILDYEGVEYNPKLGLSPDTYTNTSR